MDVAMFMGQWCCSSLVGKNDHDLSSLLSGGRFVWVDGWSVGTVKCRLQRWQGSVKCWPDGEVLLALHFCSWCSPCWLWSSYVEALELIRPQQVVGSYPVVGSCTASSEVSRLIPQHSMEMKLLSLSRPSDICWSPVEFAVLPPIHSPTPYRDYLQQ